MTPQDRELLNWELHRLSGVVQRALEQRGTGDWGPIEALERLPSYSPTSQSLPDRSGTSTSTSDVTRLTFQQVIKRQQEDSNKDLEGQKKAPRTFQGYRADVQRFVRWRSGNDIVATVTKSELDRWRDSLAEQKLSSKSIRNKLGAISAVIGWAIEQNAGDRASDPSIPELFPHGNPASLVKRPIWHKPESEELTHPMSVAQTVLYAARKADDDVACRWIPFLEAYSGMRIGEILQLEEDDLKNYGGFYYLHILANETRRTKTGLSRRVPLHWALVAEGFVEFVEAAPKGRLFPHPNTRRQVARFIRDAARPAGGLGKYAAPNHGFRHLFEDIAVGLEMGKRCYITGRVFGNSSELYGKSPAMIPKLAEALNDAVAPLIPPPAGSSSLASLTKFGAYREWLVGARGKRSS